MALKLKEYIRSEKSPAKWLFPAETAMLLYAIFTLVLVLFTATKLNNADAMIWERVRVVVTTLAVWFVYRLWPCRLMAFVRIVILLSFLGWWYPDTYELNKHFTNLDPVFAQMDQSLFGFQPALEWCQRYSSHIISEAMYFGYAMYYPMFVALTLIVFFRQYDQFQRVAFVILAGFYLYYIIYDLLPVTGPQYYYSAVGVESIAAGSFPDVGTYFASHTESLQLPGMQHGLFRNIVQAAHNTGERPTAAFPSSHVGISTLTMILALRLRQWKFCIVCAIPYLLLCFATVYIQAHYAVDAIAGFITAVPLTFALDEIYKRKWGKR